MTSPDLLPDPSVRLVNGFRAAASSMEGLSFVNPALAVEAVGFAPWQGRWLGVLLTPWCMNLILAPGDASVWQSQRQGEKQCYHFPAGEYEFIGAVDGLAGEYQMCSLFSPVLQFEDQATARLVAQLALAALFDVANAEPRGIPVTNPSPTPDSRAAKPGPLGQLEARLTAPQSKREFLRGRRAGDDYADRG